jgi:hypothetical protein
MLWDAGMGVL